MLLITYSLNWISRITYMYLLYNCRYLLKFKILLLCLKVAIMIKNVKWSCEIWKWYNELCDEYWNDYLTYLRKNLQRKLSFISGATIHNFLYSHVSYVPPDIILDKKNVAILHNTSKFVALTMSPTQSNIYNFTR